MKTDAPKTIYLKDYQPYPYDIEELYLDFNLRDGETIVTQKAKYRRKGLAQPIYLHGEDLELLNITVNGWKITGYTIDDKGMSISPPQEDSFTLEIKTKIYPEKNTRLEGLYMSGGNYCTQCEAEGFRRITYFPDRPDVLTVFTVRIEADKEKFPVLLSNGNRVNGDAVGDNRHFTIWEDPFPKPCYLFALVAGDLNHIHDTFTTKSDREVDLYIYVRPGDEDQCGHAMRSLKNSMKWDEDVYGLEYELDIFNIVAVSDFNMGAMENTSLNIFNTAFVLAAQETATDSDFGRVESVIAHEYFHNWSGNRVTCRDWFQLSLKEGLTVFRDQCFSADLNSPVVQRIDDVTSLRRLQFPEDAGPLAHPIRPDNYIEINNFYTMTVYEKGAEVIRMMKTILGAENYRKGTDLYFSRHDGQAVTCDDFVQAMQDASGIDLSQFRLWYSQAGTPVVTFRGEYDEAAGTYKAKLSQEIPDTPGQTDKKPMHIPVALGFAGRDDTEILHLTKSEQTFTFDGFSEKPVPSILRGFSAPVKLISDQGNAELSYLMLNDTDGFNRWEAAQQIGLKMINAMVDKASADEKAAPCPRYMEVIGKVLEEALEPESDKALLARILSLPAVGYIGQSRELVDPVLINDQRDIIIKSIKREHRKLLDKIYAENAQHVYEVTPEAMGKRSLRNWALAVLSSTHGTGCERRCKKHYENADNMTDRVAALSILVDMDRPAREECFGDFHARFKDYQLVIDKWFGLQASAKHPQIIQNLKDLREHPDFNIKNPNRARSVYAAFAMNNPVSFHAADGSGYTFLADAIIELNAINPQIAARLLTPMREWKRYTADRQEKMKVELERILETPDIAPDVFEIASKSLNG
ncbi:MAG: aminopeptidase N [Micavibrio sp.]|nr:aminopeptidase N [Micavibrio sp.]